MTDEIRLTLFPAEIIVRVSDRSKSPTRREQELSLRCTKVQALVNEIVQL